ncbi:MAG: Gfo/Idh/MocA family oxidoreductase [Elusimicrobia bacterium]|nr:Gfo/Idh/MocA family oxidoreductase [Elusimicrobiota bacterium]
MMHKKSIGIGLAGLGHWGPNYLRIFSQLGDSQVVACCDSDLKKLDALKKPYPQPRYTPNFKDLLSDPRIEALVVATPTRTHASLAHQALQSGKHVLVEKPLALRSREARELARTAKLKRKILMVGHTFLYNPAVLRIRQILKARALGRIHYFHAMRTNLGPIRTDVNAMQDLAPHDISILLYLLGDMPEAVQARGARFLDAKRDDIASLILHFPGNVKTFLHVSWLEPVKIRRLTIIGDKKMLVFDDTDLQEPLRLYDKGADIKTDYSHKRYRDFGEFQLVIREGDIHIPKVKMEEPLRRQCCAYLEAIRSGRPPLSSGAFGWKVVRVLEAAQKSLERKGAFVRIP